MTGLTPVTRRSRTLLQAVGKRGNAGHAAGGPKWTNFILNRDPKGIYRPYINRYQSLLLTSPVMGVTIVYSRNVLISISMLRPERRINYFYSQRCKKHFCAMSSQICELIRNISAPRLSGIPSNRNDDHKEKLALIGLSVL